MSSASTRTATAPTRWICAADSALGIVERLDLMHVRAATSSARCSVEERWLAASERALPRIAVMSIPPRDHKAMAGIYGQWKMLVQRAYHPLLTDSHVMHPARITAALVGVCTLPSAHNV